MCNLCAAFKASLSCDPILFKVVQTGVSLAPFCTVQIYNNGARVMILAYSLVTASFGFQRICVERQVASNLLLCFSVHMK